MVKFPPILKSTALLALGLFILLNGSFSLAAALNTKASKNSDQNGVLQTIDSAIQQFKDGGRPDVVLLGSSLIMAPVWTADFKRWGFAGAGDFYRHHHSKILETELSQSGRRPIEVFSFAVPGAMVSDMYLVADKILTGNKAPSLVVYGVAPRDFMDDLAAGETRTVVFDRLGEVADLNRSNFATSSFDEKFELILDRTIYLFGKRTRYQAKADSFCRRVIACASENRQDNDLFTATTAAVFPLFQDRQVLWRKSVDEYHMRYQKFNQTQFVKQQQFLQDLITTCNNRHTKLLLVNMPLTKRNLQLMPDGLYEKYLSSLETIARENSVPLLDLSKANYSDQCFYDTVHLNEVGAKSFLGSLAKVIRNDSQGQLTASVGSTSL